MKHFRKKLLTLLALTLFGGAGAWAQTPTVKEITPEMIATGWLEVYDEVTANDFPGFVAIDSAVAAAWTGAPQSGFVALFYGFESDGRIKAIGFRDGSYDGAGAANWNRDGLYHQRITNGVPIYYTTGDGTIRLTPDATGKVWTLAETPDYDLDLQVVYYQKYALKEIPAGWQVKVDGVDKTAAIDGDSLKITETAQVLLTPDHPEYVKSVRLVDVMKSLTIAAANDGLASGDAKTIEYVPGETWAQVAARYSWLKATEYGVYYDSDCGSNPCGDLKYIEGSQNNGVNPTDLVDPEKSYIWGL